MHKINKIKMTVQNKVVKKMIKIYNQIKSKNKKKRFLIIVKFYNKQELNKDK